MSISRRTKRPSARLYTGIRVFSNISTNKDENLESHPAEKGLGILVDEKHALAAQKVICIAGYIKINDKGDQKVEERDSPPLFCSHDIPPGILQF